MPKYVCAAAVFSLASQFAIAHDVAIVLTNVRSDAGVMRSVLCAKDEQFPSKCRLTRVDKATAGVVSVVFKDVPQGSYAYAVFHDEDGDGQMKMAPQRYPTEGFAFGNNAVGSAGAPTFKSASFDVNGPAKQAVRMLYMK
jgi:uncharacterized protein (DUF2141 family)